MSQQILKNLVKNSAELDAQLVLGLSGTAKAYVLSQIQKENQLTTLYVAPTLLQATQIYDDLRTLLPETALHFFPVEESVAAEFAVASQDFMAQRVEALAFLLAEKPGLVITNLAGIRHRLAPRTLFLENQLTLAVGQDYGLEDLVNHLHTMGYHREKMVESPGQFSLRGGILDVYPLTEAFPLRLEFFDSELDSIRYFDPQTQKSQGKIETARILPARDLLFESAYLQEQVPKIRQAKEKGLSNIQDALIKDQISTFFDDLCQRFEKGDIPEKTHFYTDLLYEETTILDYLSDWGLLVLDEYARLQEQEKAASLEEAQWLAQKVEEAVILPQQAIRVDFKNLLKNNRHRLLYLAHLQKGMGRLRFSEIYPFQYRTMPQFFSQMPLIKSEMDRWLKQGMTIQVFVSDKQRAEKVSQTFADFDLTSLISSLDTLVPKAINLLVGSIHNGFELPSEKMVFLNERELFNKVNKPLAKKQHLSNAERLKSYSELKPGDYVVHVNHGVGKYVGMETLDIGGLKQDYMSIIYQNDAKLFIPVTQIHLIQKYVASDGKDPRVNKLGGSEWVKTKKKVAQKIEDIADELIALYAQRESQKGHAFEKDTPDQQIFEDAFPYAETADQLRSVREIKKDMEKDKPMDRLLVGDVGYGKTEVAMRAIFKAVQEGKQVAFLVPTTILAQQHFLTLTQRFEDYPFRVALLSRFRTKAQQDETIEDLKKGRVDIVVGTHRLVSKDVAFADLGLLIIDEEQRFGVRHKERLKQLKSQVDVLTLTATPIPRTLHMSMLGVRDLSVIETPPANRYPVQTYVVEEDMGLVRDAIERELARNGQVFYLHNRVDTIQEKADQIRDLVPDANVIYAHGQMSEVQLEQVLMDFMTGQYDVLVTTTIIETGVDLPNVNTLFIENADRMGLSQLYQLRGRVGRTNRIAYAYFMYKPDKLLSETSEKRLEAIKEFTQLGAGFKIAMRDLSIRGAGNLLGKQQSGFIDSVGFDLYSEMLREAVHFKQTGVQKKIKTVEIDLGITAYIPSSYVEDERQKIDLYKRIRSLGGLEEYRELQDDFIDRFGDFPDEVADLLSIGLIKYYAEERDVESIRQENGKIFIIYRLEKSQSLNAQSIFEDLSKTKMKASVQEKEGRLVVIFDIEKRPSYAWLEELQNYLAL